MISTPANAQGFAGNDWVSHTLAIGTNVQLAITEPCPRCVMITCRKGTYPKTRDSSGC